MLREGFGGENFEGYGGEIITGDYPNGGVMLKMGKAEKSNMENDNMYDSDSGYKVGGGRNGATAKDDETNRV
jgi:hypothetical protein